MYKNKYIVVSWPYYKGDGAFEKIFGDRRPLANSLSRDLVFVGKQRRAK